MKNNSCVDNVRPSRLSRPSIFAEVEAVKEQVEFYCFARFITDKDGKPRLDRNGNKMTRTDPIYEEVCLIVAEVNLLNPDGIIKISGSELSTFIVQEVYSRLTFEHVETVVRKFQQVSAPIYNKKAYLRTALYNSVFEAQSNITNQLAQDFHGFFR